MVKGILFSAQRLFEGCTRSKEARGTERTAHNRISLEYILIHPPIGRFGRGAMMTMR